MRPDTQAEIQLPAQTCAWAKYQSESKSALVVLHVKASYIDLAYHSPFDTQIHIS
jgi:TfoX/Sxy family transcriptional regulator of competence genes